MVQRTTFLNLSFWSMYYVQLWVFLAIWKHPYLFFFQFKHSHGIQKRPKLFFSPADTFRYPKFSGKKVCIFLSTCFVYTYLGWIGFWYSLGGIGYLWKYSNQSTSNFFFFNSKTLHVVSKQVKSHLIWFRICQNNSLFPEFLFPV